MLACTQADEFARLTENTRIAPVFRILPADLLTPVLAYRRLVGPDEDSFLLESTETEREIGRYSIIGLNPAATIKQTWRNSESQRIDSDGISTTTTLQEELRSRQIAEDDRLPPLIGGAVGFWAYDYIRHLEPVLAPGRKDSDVPVMAFNFYHNHIVFDHLVKLAYVVHLCRIDADENAHSVFASGKEAVDSLCHALLSTEGRALESDHHGGTPFQAEPDMDDRSYESRVQRIQEYIRAGDAYQVVLSRSFDGTTNAEPLDVYRSLRMINPSAYMFFLRTAGQTLVGASPERLVKVSGRRVETMPIAGTRPRGANKSSDLALEKELLADPKENAEHAMLVDLGRNDLGKVSRIDSVRVDQLASVLRLSHVMHLTSRVTGELAPGTESLDALNACFPAGTVTGAPKIRAMQIIDELEETPRGVYAGAVGYVDPRGGLDTCIAIRIAEFNENRVSIRAGAGIVNDSVPRNEAAETRHKAAAMIKAVEMAEGGLSCF